MDIFVQYEVGDILLYLILDKSFTEYAIRNPLFGNQAPHGQSEPDSKGPCSGLEKKQQDEFNKLY